MEVKCAFICYFLVLASTLWLPGEAQLCPNATLCDVNFNVIESFQQYNLDDNIKTCIRCLFNDTVFSDTTWNIEDPPISLTDEPDPLGTSNNGVLEICSTNPILSRTDDNGPRFICASVTAGQSYTLFMTIRALNPPSITPMDEPLMVDEGTAELILSCRHPDSQPVTLEQWTGPDGSVLSNQSTLILTNLTRADTGLYTCTITDDRNETRNSSRTIVVRHLLIQFEQDYVSEGNIEEVCVQVTPSSIINFTVSLQQTASSRSELSISPQVLHFLPGEAEKCFIVEALEDSTLEETLESYTLELTASTAAIVLNDPLITVNIVDRDYLVIEPAVSSLEVPEGDTVTACAVIGEGSSATTLDRAVVLRVVGSATGATPGLDFSARILNPDIFLFPPGSPVGSEACLSFTIFQDNITEPEPESITLLLEAFDIGVTIPRDTATISIIDVGAPTDAPITEPPQERAVTFVGGTPIVDSSNRLIFTLLTEADSIDCRISGRVPCRVGENIVEGLDPGLYLLRVIAIFGAERVEVQRRIYIPEGEECSVVLINNGLTFDGESLEAEFGGIRGAQEFQCRINRGAFEPCESPYRIELPGIAPGKHRLRIIPTDCEDHQPQNFEFIV